MRPLLLDLFCGAGGAAKGYHDAGFDVVGVDIKPQPHYPFKFHEFDAIEVLEWLDGYDNPHLGHQFNPNHYAAIHASPPCQHWSSKTKNKDKHPDLITPLRPLLKRTGKPYVIENVEGAPLRDPVRLCGSSFGLQVRRHRLFECSFKTFQPDCNHEEQDADKRFLLYDHGKWFRSGIVHVFGTGGGKGKDYWPSAMGCGDNWDECWMTPAELAEAIPPKYTEWIGSHLMAHLMMGVAA